jgi:hypothetical protein
VTAKERRSRGGDVLLDVTDIRKRELIEGHPLWILGTPPRQQEEPGCVGKPGFYDRVMIESKIEPSIADVEQVPQVASKHCALSSRTVYMV